VIKINKPNKRDVGGGSGGDDDNNDEYVDDDEEEEDTDYLCIIIHNINAGDKEKKGRITNKKT